MIPDGAELIEVDLLNEGALRFGLAGCDCDAVLHFAAWSLVGESIAE